MKDRILNNCACVSLLFHLSIGVTFWTQQQSLFSEKDILPVKLVNEVDLNSVHLVNRSPGLTTNPQLPALSDKTPAIYKIPAIRTSEKKAEKQPELKQNVPQSPTPVISKIESVPEPEKPQTPPKQTDKGKLETEQLPQKEELPAPIHAPTEKAAEVTPDQNTTHTQFPKKVQEAAHILAEDVVDTEPGAMGQTTVTEDIELSQSAINQGTKQTNHTDGPILLSTSLVAGPNPPPTYPKLARRRGWEGEVWLIAEITTNGKVQEIRLEQSSGHSILDKTAIKAVQEWIFKPQYFQKRRIEYAIRIPVRFELKNS